MMFTALTDDDAMFAIGFVQAQDARRFGEGRLSEIAGTPTIGRDASGKSKYFALSTDFLGTFFNVI